VEGWIGALLTICPADLLVRYLLSARGALGGEGNDIFGKFIIEGDGEEHACAAIKWGGRVEAITFPTDQYKSLLDFLMHVSAYCEDLNEARNLLDFMVERVRARGTTPPIKRNRRSLDFREGDRIFIYCDVIRPSLCSDFRGKCLRILTYNPNVSHQTLFPIYYFGVEKKCVQTIHVELKTKHNEYFPFYASDQPLVIVLHFRKMR
jgi:hypothetical protein